MSLITVAEIQALGADGGLTDEQLQFVIDREEAELVRRYGYPTGSRTETIDGYDRAVFTKRRISSVSAVTETYALGDTATTLTANTDYYVRAELGMIIRLPEYIRWARLVTVTYTPVDDSNLRKQVLVELVRLTTNQDTGSTISGLGYSISGGPKDTLAWQANRESLYARLAGLV